MIAEVGRAGVAVFDDQRLYRYMLTREWGLAQDAVCWVMLNPSTADANADDATIRRCAGFTRSWGYDKVVVVNLFAWRAVSPLSLIHAHSKGKDIVGPSNDEIVLREASAARRVVCAWGSLGTLAGRGELVRARLRAAYIELYNLGHTVNAQPRHPLYLRAEEQARPWRWERAANEFVLP